MLIIRENEQIRESHLTAIKMKELIMDECEEEGRVKNRKQISDIGQVLT